MMTDVHEIASFTLKAQRKYLTSCFCAINEFLTCGTGSPETIDVLPQPTSQRIKDELLLQRLMQIRIQINDKWSKYWENLHKTEMKKITSAVKIVYDHLVTNKTQAKHAKTLEQFQKEMPSSHSIYVQMLIDLNALKLNVCIREESFRINKDKVMSGSKDNIEWMIKSLEHIASCISKEEYQPFRELRDKWPLIPEETTPQDRDILSSYKQTILGNWGRCWKTFVDEKNVEPVEVIEKIYSACVLVQTGNLHLSVWFQSKGLDKWKKLQNIWGRIMKELKGRPDQVCETGQDEQRPTEKPADRELPILKLIRLLRSCIFVLGFEQCDFAESFILEYIPESSQSESNNVAKIIRKYITNKDYPNEKNLGAFLTPRSFHRLPNDPDLAHDSDEDIKFIGEFLNTYLEYVCKVLENKTDATYYIPDKVFQYPYVWTLCKQFEDIRNQKLHTNRNKAHELMTKQEELAQNVEMHLHCVQNYEMALTSVRTALSKDSDLEGLDVCPTCEKLLSEHLKSLKVGIQKHEKHLLDDFNNESKLMTEERDRERQKASDMDKLNLKIIQCLENRTEFSQKAFKADLMTSIDQNFEDITVRAEGAINRLLDHIKSMEAKCVMDSETQSSNGKTNQALQDLLQNLKMERDMLLNRLSKFVGAKLKDGNPSITDLSDPNRPLKLAEQYGEIYDSDWTNAMEYLIGIGKGEKECTGILLELVTDAYNHCVKKSEQQWENITGSFCYNDGEDISTLDLTDTEQHQFKTIRRNTADISKEEIVKTFLRKQSKWNKHLMLKTFMSKCASLCWYMVVQDPPLAIKYDFKKGDIFEKDYLKEYTQLGDKISFLVWPTLLLHSDGPVLQKGVAQPISNTPKTEKN